MNELKDLLYRQHFINQELKSLKSLKFGKDSVLSHILFNRELAEINSKLLTYDPQTIEQLKKDLPFSKQ